MSLTGSLFNCIHYPVKRETSNCAGVLDIYVLLLVSLHPMKMEHFVVVNENARAYF